MRFAVPMKELIAAADAIRKAGSSGCSHYVFDGEPLDPPEPKVAQGVPFCKPARFRVIGVICGRCEYENVIHDKEILL